MNIKKTIVTMSLVLATTLGSVQKSHAIVGVCSWNPPLIGAGFLIHAGSMIPGAVAGGLFMVGQYAFQRESILAKIGGVVSYGIGGLAGAAAVVMSFGGFALLPDGTTGLEFSTMTEADQVKLGVTAAEAQSFNSELEQVNLIMREVTTNLNHLEKPTVEDTAREFANFDGLLSEKTLKALEKISLQMIK